MDVLKTLLERGSIANIDLIEPLQEGIAEILIADEDGVLIRVQDATYASVLFKASAAPRFADVLCNCKDPISVHEGVLVAALKERGFSLDMECYQAVYTSKEPLTRDPSITIRPLQERDIPLVIHHYAHEEEAYIRQRYQAGVMIAAEIDGTLAGFMGRHTECAMGLLVVLPQYRRLHVGEALERAYIHKLLAQGTTPYCHVVVDNVASLSLQKKLGLKISPERVYWMNL
ncbi:MAG: N-acetyltransferase family protein [Sphaerochaeta sp.]